MKTQAQWIAAVVTVGISVMLGGCGGGRTIHIQGDRDIAKQSVRVDIVGISAREKDQWPGGAMREYWSQGNENRRHDANDAGYLAFRTFEPGKSPEIVITEKDPVWKKWKESRATHFLVLFDTCTQATGWYTCLPLSPKCWKGRLQKKTIEVDIKPSGVRSRTAPSPKAACQCQ